MIAITTLTAVAVWSAKTLADDLATGTLSAGDLFSTLDDNGLVSHNDIQSELSQIVGDNDPLDWTHMDLKKEFGDSRFTLAQIVTYVSDFGSNFEVLFNHTLPTQDQPETMTTEYTRRINGAEESTVGTSIVVPRMFDAADGFSNTTSTQSNASAAIPEANVTYNFQFKAHPLVPTFDLRAPEGTYDLTSATPTSFDPIGWISAHGLRYTWTDGISSYDVTVTPRESDSGQLIFEIENHQEGTGVMSTTVLVYNQI